MKIHIAQQFSVEALPDIPVIHRQFFTAKIKILVQIDRADVLFRSGKTAATFMPFKRSKKQGADRHQQENIDNQECAGIFHPFHSHVVMGYQLFVIRLDNQAFVFKITQTDVNPVLKSINAVL